MGKNLQPDLATFLGLVIALGGIVGGLLLEGGKLSDITQLTGALIVLGGTAGAVMITTPGPTLIGAVRQLKVVFLRPSLSAGETVADILRFAHQARKNGIVSLEENAVAIPNAFFRKALMLAVDGTDLADLKRVMEAESFVEAQRARSQAKVFDAAGGYAPTIGIIGAVLGLIQVMKHLDDIDQVGHGIAVAFVATVYGVASANLLFLPIAAKIRARADEAAQFQHLILEGISGIVQGLHPKIIERTLEAWTMSPSGAPVRRLRSISKASSVESSV